MKLSDVTVQNIKSFFTGYARFYYDKIAGLPTHTKEQIFYRIYICRDICIPFGKCKICTCPAIEKSYSTQSCNPQEFPDLLNKEGWLKYKEENNISQETIDLVKVEVEKLF